MKQGTNMKQDIKMKLNMMAAILLMVGMSGVSSAQSSFKNDRERRDFEDRLKKEIREEMAAEQRRETQRVDMNRAWLNDAKHANARAKALVAKKQYKEAKKVYEEANRYLKFIKDPGETVTKAEQKIYQDAYDGLYDVREKLGLPGDSTAEDIERAEAWEAARLANKAAERYQDKGQYKKAREEYLKAIHLYETKLGFNNKLATETANGVLSLQEASTLKSRATKGLKRIFGVR